MTTITASLTQPRRRAVPTRAERMLLRMSRRLEAIALTRMERRASATNPVTEESRREADDRRRTAHASGSLGLLPR